MNKVPCLLPFILANQAETPPCCLPFPGDAAAIPSLADSLPATITTANVPASPSISSRVVCYMTAPSSLVKSVLATELMRYSRADAGGYLVEVYVATPDVPYGNTFRTEMQFCITPSPGTTSLLPSLHSPTPDVPYGNTFRTKMQFCITPGPGEASSPLHVGCFDGLSTTHQVRWLG
ncbi:unnamed protein product [Closterium sp. NIES-53]